MCEVRGSHQYLSKQSSNIFRCETSRRCKCELNITLVCLELSFKFIRIVLIGYEHLEGFKALFHRLKSCTFSCFKTKDLLHIRYTI